ncbi:hypothetical protein QWY85_04625 [Neolewinella lacunae]|uniref:Uncharacterized protein n=1 Tax=Neolewinella lacunae TaxID=1517758 RepID=A0A923PRC9_9BACT|nr:hypothetical protein [Neolewinella lacunae]MBC6996079.1 hypothetical protein [Neolewinella lacunae]MDN3633932.1 hypothetical protein [Neolewinella lacunae]
MQRTLLGLLLIFSATALSAQRRGPEAYHRGVSIAVELGLETERRETYSLFLRNPPVLPNPETPQPPPILLVRPGNDTLRYFFQEDTDFSGRPARRTQRYNFQVKLEKKLLSGMEFGGGVFFSSGSLDTELENPAAPFDDFAYRVSKVDYLKYGVSAILKFHLFQHRRLQPHLGIQPLFHLERVNALERSVIFPAYGIEHPVALPPDPYTFFVLDLRLLCGLSYSLTDRFLLGLNAVGFSATRRAYLGLEWKYRLTDY